MKSMFWVNLEKAKLSLKRNIRAGHALMLLCDALAKDILCARLSSFEHDFRACTYLIHKQRLCTHHPCSCSSFETSTTGEVDQSLRTKELFAHKGSLLKHHVLVLSLITPTFQRPKPMPAILWNQCSHVWSVSKFCVLIPKLIFYAVYLTLFRKYLQELRK